MKILFNGLTTLDISKGIIIIRKILYRFDLMLFLTI